MDFDLDLVGAVAGDGLVDLGLPQAIRRVMPQQPAVRTMLERLTLLRMGEQATHLPRPGQRGRRLVA